MRDFFVFFLGEFFWFIWSIGDFIIVYNFVIKFVIYLVRMFFVMWNIIFVDIFGLVNICFKIMMFIILINKMVLLKNMYYSIFVLNKCRKLFYYMNCLEVNMIKVKSRFLIL